MKIFFYFDYYMSDCIELNEYFDAEKLNQVLDCDIDKLPFGSNDTQKKYSTMTRLYNLAKFPIDNNKINVKYHQKNNFGRYYANIGLQSIPKEIRKYITGNKLIDLDFQNCHPNILSQLIEKNDLIIPQQLNQYNNDREKFLKQYSITKENFLSLLFFDKCKINSLLGIHNCIFKQLIPLLKKKECYAEIHKKSKKDNKNGSFISFVIQDIENNLLMALKDFLEEKGIIINTLMFDGMLVSNNKLPENIETFLKEASQHIFQKTGYQIKIVQKDNTTEWIPTKSSKNILQIKENEEFSIEEANRLYLNIKDEEGKIIEYNKDIFMDYINKYVCLFNEPHIYGWRQNISEQYAMRRKVDITDRIGGNCITMWNRYDNKKLYDKMDFIIDERFIRNKIYNLYVRPPINNLQIDITSQDQLKDISPKLHDYLLRIVCSNNERYFNYIIHYISKMFQVGRTEQGIVLQGKKGCGKTIFSDICKKVVGEEYGRKINDIENFTKRFNSLFEKAIVISVEEVISNAGDYHSVQSKLKDLITADKVEIERKGIESYTCSSNFNLIFTTNEFNPVKISDDNRRYFVLRIGTAEQNNRINYFTPLLKEVNEKIQDIRYFFYNYPYIDDLNSIRPHTEFEEQLRLLNRNTFEVFVEECLDNIIQFPDDTYDKVNDIFTDEPVEERKLDNFYDRYTTFCRENNIVNKLKKNYFSRYLTDYNYNVVRKRFKGDRFYYII